MAEISLIVEREKVTVSGRESLRNYWYKFIIQLIQKVFDVFQDSLGSEDFQLLWELLENQDDLVNSAAFNPNDFDERLTEIGNSITDNVDDNASCEWIFNNKVICVSSRMVNDYSEQLFDDLILPYLQINHNTEVSITGKDKRFKCFFLNNLRRNGYAIVEKTGVVSAIELVKEDSWAVEWKENDVFIVKCDLNTMIPICVLITTKQGKSIHKTVEISFPFYQKNDKVSISISSDELKWNISAINEDNSLEFVSEINI